jgi:hypothetical protein
MHPAIALSGAIFSAVTLGGGSGIFLIFLIVMFFAFGWSYYTRRGSGINLRPWHERGSSAEGHPPSLSHDESDDVRNWTRGTRPPRESRRTARRRNALRDPQPPTGSRTRRLSIRRRRSNPVSTDTKPRTPDSADGKATERPARAAADDAPDRIVERKYRPWT